MTISISEEEKKKCLDFAMKIIKTKNQYPRLGADEKKRVQRTCVGKIAEYAFLKYIRENYDSDYPEGDMFEIYEGESNVDSYDFQTKNSETVDIKTAFLPNHKNVMIPLSQLQNMPKDKYVGIKLNGKFENPWGDKQLVDIDSITTAEIIGYKDYDDIVELETRNWGADCKALNLDTLEEIDFEF